MRLESCVLLLMLTVSAAAQADIVYWTQYDGTADPFAKNQCRPKAGTTTPNWMAWPNGNTDVVRAEGAMVAQYGLGSYWQTYNYPQPGTNCRAFTEIAIHDTSNFPFPHPVATVAPTGIFYASHHNCSAPNPIDEAPASDSEEPVLPPTAASCGAVIQRCTWDNGVCVPTQPPGPSDIRSIDLLV